MMSKFPGSDHSCRRRYVIKLFVGKKNNNEIYICEAVCEAVEKKPREQISRTVSDSPLTFKQHFRALERKSLTGHVAVVGGHATIGRLSNNVFSTFQANRNFFEKSRWTVTWQWSEVTRLSADCQTTFFRRFKQFEIFVEKSRWTVTRQWSEVTRPSADCQTTFFGRFKRLENFEKSRWTVTRQWSEVTRPSADCQTTFFGRFKQLENFLKKVAERSRDSGRRSRDRRPTVKQRFLDVSSN